MPIEVDVSWLAAALRVAAVAVELVNNGVQLIESCGGLGPMITAKVIEAAGDACLSAA